MKLAHLADLHLGFRQFDRQTSKGANQREVDVAEAFRRAVDDILEQTPDLIVIAGDLFHSVRPTNAAILYCFRQLHRLRTGLPNSPIVVIAGEHDTPRSTETGSILRLYEALGVEIAVEDARRIVLPKLDCAVLAVPQQALAKADRPALRPEPGGPTLNVLVAHGVYGGLGEERGTMEYGGAELTRELLAPEKWDYIALGHYHTAQSVATNAWYAGSLEYLPPNPWGQLQDEAAQRAATKGKKERKGKGYLLVDLPGARVTFRPIEPVRRHIDLPFIQGAGLNAKELDTAIAERVNTAKIDDQIVRLVVWDVERATARDLDHAAIRAFKARALNFHLDLRRPQAQRVPSAGVGAGVRRQTLADTLRDFLGGRPLDAELNRETFVKLGVDYLEAAARADESGGGGERRMKLHRLRLVNFRQHADTEIAFGDGVTGIIGPNGSGKTSLLEAIAWAIYGNPAARGDKDSIRNLRAKARAPMRVELEFSLGNRTYFVERKLNEAALHENGIVVANSIKEVTARLQRVLGMTYDEFFNTYFTGQKELAVLADATRPERAAFLSRVLRHEQLTIAQERVRERRNALGHEVEGLETGLPPQSELEKERKATAARLSEARKAATAATTERQTAQQALAAEEPRWQQWVERRERTLSLHGDLRVAEQGVVVARQEFQRLDKELAEALGAREELRKLDADVAPITRLKGELVELERLHREDAARREDQAKITELTRNLSVLDRRLAELAEAEAGLEQITAQARELKERLAAADTLAGEQQATWVREKEYASTKRAELLKQHDEVKDHRDKVLKLGPEGECPTCRRPLGAEHDAVVGVLHRQLEAIVEDGKYFKHRIEQLAQAPAAVTEAEQARDALREEVRLASEREGTLREQSRERARLQKERAGLARRTEEMERRVAARDGGYNADRHNEVRAELARLEPVALQAAALKARADRAEALVSEAELAEKALSAREEQVKQLGEAVKEQGFSEPKFQAARERHDRAAHALRAGELAVAESRGELVAAETAVRETERRVAERAARERIIGERKVELRLHNELDRAFSDLRARLNEEMRPEISTLASAFLSDLTDARYDEVDLDENYQVVVLDEGVPKPVISGGEEDIANLVLRLAISQMIAERAGQPLSLLVLDEIFGSLDESRRQHVLGLLRRLGDRFPQVILITHIEQVRDGLDRVIRVTYDATTGTSVVRDDTATLGPPDASVAA